MEKIEKNENLENVVDVETSVEETVCVEETVDEVDSCDNRKNVNIADCFPIMKKHPYLTLGVICVLLNLGTRQESISLVSSWLPAIIFGLLAVGCVVYMSKTTDDFVLSPRGVLFLVPVFAFVALTGKAFNGGEKGTFIGALLTFVALLVLFLVLKLTKRLTFQNALLLVFAVGLVTRVIYALYTPIADNSIRQHDVWRFIASKGDELLEQFNNRRHAEYIEYIARYLKLPDVDPSGGLSQLYHPPLHHIFAGLWLRLNITLGMGYKQAVEGIQMLTVFYSSTCMITGYKIFKELGLEGKKLFKATALISLFPWFFLFAGGVNNDMLSIALGFGAILMTIKWYKNPKITNLLLVAVTLGLAMFTKLSMGLLAPAIAYVFLTKFISVCKTKQGVISTSKGEKNIGALYMICGFALFAVVIFPLGLGWQVKNLILWDMPLTYVPSLSHTNVQYIGFHSILERLFGINLDCISNPFVIWGDKGEWGFWEYNMFLGALKTSLFGEDAFFALGTGTDFKAVVVSTIGVLFSTLLYIFALGLVALSFVSIYYFFKNKFYGLNKTLVTMIVVICATVMVNYVIFCFGYPFTCTMNFRYIVPCLLLPAISLSMMAGKEKTEVSLFENVMITFSGACIRGFCIFGVISYVLLALMPF